MNKRAGQFGRVGILMGGVSSEREISLRSGRAIADALSRQGIDVMPLDILDDNNDTIVDQLQEADMDVAFIALHGRLGEDGTIQSILEKLNIPYTGSGVDASRLAFDKAATQNLLEKNNVSIPSYVTLSKGDQLDTGAVSGALGPLPFIVKPAREGSSIGITLVKQEDELTQALVAAWHYSDTALIEKCIEGREFTVGILGQVALPVVEIRSKRLFFDYESKYTKGATEYIVPAAITDEMTRELQQAALQAHRVLGCEDLSRVDIMIDGNRRYYVLEVNTIPGFTSTSLLPKAAMNYGLSFDQLCLKLTELAHGKKEKIKNTPVR